jgi:hypothetical protein
VRRYFPGQLQGIPKYNLCDTQVYPGGINFHPAIEKATKNLFRQLNMTRETAVASIGTCFAEEFASHMKRSNGNYLQLEENIFNASANWGRVYTIPNLKQIVEYSLSERPVVSIECDGRFIDPTREKSIGLFLSQNEAHDAIVRHRHCSAEVFRKAKVLVITLGQNETWEDKEAGLYWGSIPPGQLREKQSGRFRPVMFDSRDCYDQLKETIAMIRRDNPGLKIILTVSPVAAYATFLSENVVTQSMEGKAILRAVAGEICRVLPDVFYFPSFEMVMCYNPHTFTADNRHVKRKTVSRIFALLDSVIK